MSLRARLTLVGVAVLAVTIAAVALVAYQLSRVQGRTAVDRVIRQELADIEAGLPPIVAELAGGGDPTDAQLVAAVERYLAVNPGSRQHLTVVTVGSERISTVDGPPALLDLYDDNRFPTGELRRLQTVDTPRGDVRLLTTPLNSGSAQRGTIAIAGPLDEVNREARETLARISLAGVVGLAVGAAALTLLTRQALAPLTRLAEAARGIGPSDLTVRVPEPPRQDEVGVVATELNHLLDRLDEADRRRQELLAAISHELRTPVAVASGHLEMLETLGATDEHTPARVAATVRAELGRLSGIIDDLTAVARGSDAGALEVGPVFLPDLFDDLAERAAGLNIQHLTIEPPPPVVVELDHNRMLQTLLNLVVNASVHTPDSTRINVRAAEAADHVVLTVADDGPGIDPDLLDTVFEPFVTSRRGGPNRASGLGLSVARAWTEAHHGTLEIASSPAGTTATITLPREQPEDG